MTRIEAQPLGEIIRVERSSSFYPEKPPPILTYPMGQERLNMIAGKFNLLPIAEHEAGHGLIAYLKGEGGKIKEVSVVPNSDRLGEVSFYGNLFNFEAIAAGGSMIKGIYGSPSGYGSDLQKIALTGGSVSRGQREARGILSSIPDEVITNISEMLVLKGTVNSAEFDAIVKQAYYEAGLKHEFKSYQTVKSELITRIIYVDQFTTIIRKEMKDQIISEESFFHCPVCHGKSTHLPGCINLKDNKNTPTPGNQPPKPSGPPRPPADQPHGEFRYTNEIYLPRKTRRKGNA